MKFFADFHVHSKYSRATAKNLDLENLYIAGQLKGITVLGTGDVTHPAWFSEIKEKLVPAEPGLFKLNPDIAKTVDQHIPPICRSRLRFILVTEISNIYKKQDKTRKNHNLVFFSSFESVEKFNQTLDKIGNIHSDGRPILGLDAKHLLEISLETSPKNFLVPAHIWTPWFSMLGSKSGFDTIEACFEELTPHIFAVETGLSSDPQMNWRVKNLDGLTLISNSDAHSPLKVGREANIFNTDLSYGAIKKAIKTGDPQEFCGTIEFFPEEGKYHFDGHRKCNYRSGPRETIQKDGRCPVCQKPMTLGVLYRVEELADRPEGQRPEKNHPFYHSIPLIDILSELLGVGPNSKKVQRAYHDLLQSLGSEFDILHQLPVEKLNQTDIPLLADAIKRIRASKIHIDAGFDGQFGTIRLFSRQEREKLSAQKRLFAVQPAAMVPQKRQKRIPKTKRAAPQKQSLEKTDSTRPLVLNQSQSKVVHHPGGANIIVAGPGTGKTFTLTHRIAHLIKKRQVAAANILGLTFTNQAAGEMLVRLRRLLPQEMELPLVTTFHSFCLRSIQTGDQHQIPAVIDDREQLEIIKDAKTMARDSGVDVSLRHEQLADAIRYIKQEYQADADKLDQLTSAEKKSVNAIYQCYQQILKILGLVDFEDLIGDVVRLFENDLTVRTAIQKQYPYVFVDEYQDINTGQYRLLKKLAQPETEICVIGDPDQSIYGFRGSHVHYFHRFHEDYPGAERIQLHQNYRSTQTILNVAQQMIQKTPDRIPRQQLYSENQGTQKVGILACKNDKHEAVTIGKMIESMVGGVGFYSIDFGKTSATESETERSFSDFVILYRTAQQSQVIAEMLSSAGIPIQVAIKKNRQYCPRVLATISFLRMLSSKGSYGDLHRILPYLQTGIGKKSFDSWKFWAYQNRQNVYEALNSLLTYPIATLSKRSQTKLAAMAKALATVQSQISAKDPGKTINTILEQTSLGISVKDDPQKQQQLEELKQKTYGFDGDLPTFLNRLALQTETDQYDSRVEKVSLMTMHASKGLEFPVVFITGCENGLIPFIPKENKYQDIQEERRLFYVAMTRAKQELYLSHVKKRKVHGKIGIQSISPFVTDVEQKLQQMNQTSDNKTMRHRQTQLALFSD